MMKGKKNYRKPVMAVEKFVANEYVSGCEFKWKYEGTGVEGDYINEGTYQSDSDYWDKLYYLTGPWHWNGDPQIANNWKTDEAASFLTNTNLGESVPSSYGYYSGVAGNTYSLNLRRYFTVKDNSVYKYSYNNKDYYSGDRFERKRNYS